MSPRRTRTAPSDCLAIRPVSIERVYLPRGISTRCIAISFLSAPLGVPPMGTPCPAGAFRPSDQAIDSLGVCVVGWVRKARASYLRMPSLSIRPRYRSVSLLFT